MAVGWCLWDWLKINHHAQVHRQQWRSLALLVRRNSSFFIWVLFMGFVFNKKNTEYSPALSFKYQINYSAHLNFYDLLFQLHPLSWSIYGSNKTLCIWKYFISLKLRPSANTRPVLCMRAEVERQRGREGEGGREQQRQREGQLR